MNPPTPPRQYLPERLETGPVICAEGYVFELERRGYLQTSAFVPEAVPEHPEVVTQLHRDFVHAGSDVVEALTYCAHREKLRVIGREQDLEPINRRALDPVKAVATESGALFAGDICNTNVDDPTDPASHRAVRAMFEEQVGWAVDAGVDYIVGETFSWAQEALIALDIGYLGVCCGAGPHHIRALAEAVGKHPPASRYSADMSKHAFLDSHERIKKVQKDYADKP